MKSSRRPIQYFSKDYLESVRHSTPDQVLDFLDQFMRLNNPGAIGQSRMRLISLRMPEPLLAKIKARAKKEKVPYQKLIRDMLERELKN